MENMIIESDNLRVLKNFQGEYKEKIDLIIIDPPYNTNIDNIGYKDNNFKDGWISFMKPRLKLAYPLLSNTGVMFIHIDENELINLSMLCYEIFGYNNINIMVWKKINEHFDKNRIEKETINIKSSHEYVILCYKNRNKTKLNNMMQPKLVNDNWVEVNIPMESVLDNLGTTSSAKDEMESIFGNRRIFSTPKPMRLVKEFVRVATTKQSIILDFYAGSGTTGHAVMDLNKDDNGKRTFILVTNNESDICQRVTIPRIKTVIEKNNYKESFVIS